MPLPIIHFAALSSSLTHFSIRGRLTYLSRQPDTSLPVSITLTPLTPLPSPSSLTSPPAPLVVIIPPLWRPGLRHIHQSLVLQIDCPTILPNPPPFRLQLPTSPSPSLTSLVAVHVIHPVDNVFSSLPFSSLSSSSACLSVPPPRTTSGYNYTPISQLWNIWQENDRASGREKRHVWGVVLDARAPTKTRGPDLRSEVEIVDETSFIEGRPIRTLKVYTFHKEPDKGVPFRAFGDIVRVRRMHLQGYKYRDQDKFVLMAQMRNYSTVVLWKGDGEDEQPFAVKEPTGRGKGGKAWNGGDQDELRRLGELRKWSREFLLKRCRVRRSFVSSVTEVVGKGEMREGEEILAKVSAIRDVEGRPEVELFSEEGTPVLIKVAEGPESFDKMCPSWRLRPRNLDDFWLLIRDACFTCRENNICLLKVGHQTSTIVWYPVEFAKAQFQALGPIDTSTLEEVPKEGRFWIAPELLDLQNDSFSGSQVVGSQHNENPIANTRIPEIQTAGSQRRNIPSSQGKQTALIQKASTTEIEGVSSVYDYENGFRKIKEHVRSLPRPGNCPEKRHKVLAQLKHCVFPQDLRQASRPVCSRCREPIPSFRESPENFQCSGCPNSKAMQDIEWEYCIKFWLRDKCEEGLETWIIGEEGVKFFGIQPCNFFVEKSKFVDFLKRLRELLSEPFLEREIIPYEYEGEDDIYQIAGMLVYTLDR